MHNAILKNDLEAVLFLLSVHVDVNNRTRDSSQRTPLQLATVVGNDMMVRNLVSERGGVTKPSTNSYVVCSRNNVSKF